MSDNSSDNEKMLVLNDMDAKKHTPKYETAL